MPQAYRSFSKRVEPYLFLAPVVLTMTALLGFPLAYNIGISFFEWELGSPEMLFTGLGNYLSVFLDANIGGLLYNSIAWTVLGVGSQFAVGLLLALAINSLRKKAAGILQTIVILPWIIPGVITSVIWQCMLQSDLGIVNYLLRVLGIADQDILWFSSGDTALYALIFINTWKAAPFWFLMIYAALLDVPRDQSEAAELDGAGILLRFYHVTWQHLKPVVMSTLILTTIWTFNSFDIIWTITKGGPLDATATLPIYTYLEAFSYGDYGRAAALSVFSFFAVMAISFPYIRSMLSRVKDDAS